ncbi:hypothetical protein PS2_010432 [Malus domestica]
MEDSSNSGSRKRKTREMPLRQVVLALAAPNTFPPRHLQTTTTKMSGRREKSKEAVLDRCAPPPQLQTTTTATTTDRAGTREKTEEVALALSPPSAPPQPLNITANDGTKSDYSVRPKPPPSKPACHGQKRKQEKVAAASALQGPEKEKPSLEVVRVRFLDPDATESSSDDDHTPPVTNGRKRKEVEIVHEIKILGKNPNTKRRKTQETITKTRRKIKKDQKTEEELVGEKIVIKKEIGSSSCGEKVKKPSSTSSTAGKKETKETETKKKTTKEVVEVLWDIPGEIPDLDLLEQEKHRLLYRFFDGIPEDCEDIPPEVKVK